MQSFFECNNMTTLLEGMRNIDIELTNRCNAQCTFCPRDQTPEQGFMSFETFKKSVERATELKTTPKYHFCGQGEPTLHPQFVEFAEYMQSLGLEYGFTTNGSLLTEEQSTRILDANVNHMVFSISDLGEDYEEVYALNFDSTRTNILRFLDMNETRGKPVRTTISLVKHDLNSDKLGKYRLFWEEAGIDDYMIYSQVNRGGACDNGRYFENNNRHKEQAQAILKTNGLTHVCNVPFLALFVGWNGQYYLCTNDYRKLTPLGSVFDYSIEEIDIIKKAKFFEREPAEACRNCDIDVTNRVREVLFEIENGQAREKNLDSVIAEIAKSQKKTAEIFIARQGT
jgi:MoaA/NifB/PqqE/SkfB family radical SAM enzyme